MSVFILLALAALTGWLLSCVRHAANGRAALECRAPGVLLAMAPGVDPLVMKVVIFHGLIFLGTFGGVGGAIWLITKRSTRARLQGGDLASPTPCDDPLGMPCVGMTRDEMVRILAAAIVECCTAEDLVRKATSPDPRRLEGPVYCTSCGVLAAIHPKADVRLGEAMKCLRGLQRCLGNLAECAARSTGESEAVNLTAKQVNFIHEALLLLAMEYSKNFNGCDNGKAARFWSAELVEVESFRDVLHKEPSALIWLNVKQREEVS